MYRTQYKTLYRVHTVEEAIEFDIPVTPTDLFLYLIDTYDVLLSITSGQLPKPPKRDIVMLRQKLSDYLLKHFHDMYKPVPGALYGWTESMLLWVVLLSVIEMQHHTNKEMELNKNLLRWIKSKRIRMFEDIDMTTWNLDTLICQMDSLALRWHELEPCKELEEFLEILWRFAARFTLRMHTKDVLNIETYIDEVPQATRYKLTSDGMMTFLSRYYWFTHMIELRNLWQIADDREFTPQDKTNWSSWILNERKHFVTRRFRDGISDWMWDKMTLFGDAEIASHDQLGDEVSAFTCMYARFPAGLVSGWQKILTYEEYEDIIKCVAIRDFVHIQMIQAHFSSVYNVSFLKYFFVYDKIMHRHIDAITKASTPIIFYWYKQYMCYYHGKVYRHPDGCNIEHAFTMWICILREELDGKCYGSMDFSELCGQLLDQKQVVNNDRQIAGYFDLDDD